MFCSGRSDQICIWLLVIWFAVPLAWGSFTAAPYFLHGAKGLQASEITAPILFVLSCWAIALSIPQTRSPLLAHAAGGFVLGLAFFLSYYQGFENTAGFAIIPLALALMRSTPSRPEVNCQDHCPRKTGWD